MIAMAQHPTHEEFILDPDEEIQALIKAGRSALKTQINGNAES